MKMHFLQVPGSTKENKVDIRYQLLVCSKIKIKCWFDIKICKRQFRVFYKQVFVLLLLVLNLKIHTWE